MSQNERQDGMREAGRVMRVGGGVGWRNRD